LALFLVACGADMSKEDAISKASEVADLSTWKIVWVDAPDLGGGPVVNLPGSFGATFAEARTIYVVSAHPSVLIHEAVHVANDGDGGHCEWAKLWVPYFEREGVWGNLLLTIEGASPKEQFSHGMFFIYTF